MGDLATLGWLQNHGGGLSEEAASNYESRRNAMRAAQEQAAADERAAGLRDVPKAEADDLLKYLRRTFRR